MILHALREIQRVHGYLPVSELRALAERTGTPLDRLYEVVRFHRDLHLQTPGATIRICRDAACHLRGAARLYKRFQQEGIGQNWMVMGVSCLGECDRAPVAAVQKVIQRDVTDERIAEIATKLREGETIPDVSEAPPIYSDIGDFQALTEPYEVLRRVAREDDPASVIQALIDSGLRGMGGAGFPTGLKWKTVREADATEKYVVCNFDESEPGTFKDRALAHAIPSRVIEGILIGALVVEAREAIIFIRHQYEAEKALLEEEAERAAEVLASVGREVPLRIFASPGGYICGEETALLEALEGKRPQPRIRPPFPATAGYLGKPTLLSNLETFSWVPTILAHGGDWFRAQGQNDAAGLKAYSVSGAVKRPGVYVTSLGITARELIEGHAGGIVDGKTLKAFAPGGVAAGFLPASAADVPLDFGPLREAGSMLGTGATIVIADDTCMFDLALNATEFFEEESCGKCVPCRAGTLQLVETLRRFQQGTADRAEFDHILELGEMMRTSSFCGLGQAAPNALLSAMKHFEEEMRAHLDRRCPVGVCFNGAHA